MSTSAIVISASYDKQVRLWDTASGRTIRSFTFQDSQVNSLYLIPNTSYLAVLGFGVVRVYEVHHPQDTAAQQQQQQQRGSLSGAVDQAAAQAQAQLLNAVNLTSTSTTAGAAGGAAGGANAVPPLITSFVSLGSMNFTSVGAFPLGQRGAGLADALPSLSHSSDEEDDTDDSLMHTLMVAGSGALHDVSKVLYATSEDGHIRFFDLKASSTMRVIKDIATGAAITCSALSPDRRFLLTGSQIGLLSVWHLPSVILSVSEQVNGYQNRLAAKKRAEAAAAAAAATAAAAVPGTDASTAAAAAAAAGGASPPPAATAGEAKAEAAPAPQPEDDPDVRERLDNAIRFGSRPLQEIAFDGDYSAIRSIAIDPLARWAVVATNAGKVHFLRFSNDSLLYGTKSEKVRELQLKLVAYREKHKALKLVQQKQQGGDDSGKDGGAAAAAAAAAGGGGGGGDGYTAPSSVDRNNSRFNQNPSESIYRTALIMNEIGNSAVRRGSDGSGTELSTGMHQSGVSTNGAGSVGAGGHVGSMGAALLNSLEVQNSKRNWSGQWMASITSGMTPGGNLLSAAAAAANGSNANAAAAEAPPLSALEAALELEPFYSFQPHFKYLLRVVISPSAELLMTCSADYTIGRFHIPELLRPQYVTDQAAAAAAAAGPTVSLRRSDSLSATRSRTHSRSSRHSSSLSATVSATGAAAAGGGGGGDGGSAAPRKSLESPLEDAQDADAEATAGTPDNNNNNEEDENNLNEDAALALTAENLSIASTQVPELRSLDQTLTAAGVAAAAAAAATAGAVAAEVPSGSGSGSCGSGDGAAEKTKDDKSASLKAPASTAAVPTVVVEEKEEEHKSNPLQADGGEALEAVPGGESAAADGSSSSNNNKDGASSPASSSAAPGSPIDVQKKKEEAELAELLKSPGDRFYFAPLPPLQGHQRWVWDGAFSVCSKYFFSASSDNCVKMWNQVSGEKPQSSTFMGHTKPVVALAVMYPKDKKKLQPQ